MAILVPRWLDFRWRVRVQMCLKFCMVETAVCMGSPNEQYNFERYQTFPSCRTLRLARELLARANLSILLLGNAWYLSKLYCSFGLPIQAAISTIQNFRHIWTRTCQLKSSRLVILKLPQPSQFLFLEADFYLRLCRIARRIVLDQNLGHGNHFS